MKAVSRIMVEVALIVAAIVVASVASYTIFGMFQAGSRNISILTQTSASKTGYGIRIQSNLQSSGTMQIDSIGLTVYGNITCYSFDGSTSYIRVDNVPVNTASGTYNTVAFLMYWTGTFEQMPFGWQSPYDLYFSGNGFGFNTGGGDVYGISDATNFLANKWVFVIAVFPNGYPSYEPALYLNGAKQPLQLLRGTRYSRSCTTTLYVSGWGANNYYRFGGYVANLFVYNRMLSDAEAIQLTTAILYRNNTIPTSGLVLWLDESTISQTKWADRTQYRHDGTVYGATVSTAKTVITKKFFQPMYAAGMYGCSPWGTTPGFPDPTAYWIWKTAGAASSAPVEKFHAKRVFNLDYSTTITVKATADDYFTLYVDGNTVGSGSSWTQTYTFTVPLSQGKHVIEFETGNTGGPAGLICSVYDGTGKLLFNTVADGQWYYLDNIGSTSIKFNMYNVDWIQVGTKLSLEWTAYSGTSTRTVLETVTVT
jgi:hypothetical protein